MILSRSLYPIGSWRGALYEMDRLRQEMGRLLGSGAVAGEAGYAAQAYPLVNVAENAEAYIVRAELPGVDPSALEITVLGKNLSLKGERGLPQVPEGARFHRRERSLSGFSRVITLPGEVQADKVTAQSERGVLTITLPKVEEAKPKKIAVQAA